jgi:L-lactate dehydrogenase (cytochrome)
MSRFPVWWFNKLTTGGLTFASLADVPGNPSPGEVASMVFDPGLDLTSLAWLRERWPGRLLVKGVTTPASAAEVMEHGADGVVVSNHGGRQLDRSAATLDVLPVVREAVGPQATVLVDGGVLHGQDVLAARALGADAVMIGRAYLYGLMAGGRDGVLRAYEILAEEYLRSMQLLGVRRSADLSDRHVAFSPHAAGDYPGVSV